MITKWKIKGQCDHDAQNIKTVVINANGREKAKVLGKKKIQAKYESTYVDIISCEKINDD